MKNEEIQLIREELKRRKEKAADIYSLFDALYDFVDIIEREEDRKVCSQRGNGWRISSEAFRFMQ